MSELLKTCEQDFLRVLTGANKKLAALAGPGNYESLIKDVQSDLQKADQALKQFENELRSSPPSIANQYEARLKRHIENLIQLKRTIANEELRRQKQDLMGRQPDDPQRKGRPANEALLETGDMLDRTLKVGIESELLASDVVSSLKHQREKIIGISGKVNDIDTNVHSAKQVISRMDHRRVWMKVLMCFTILLLITANGVVLYIKLK